MANTTFRLSKRFVSRSMVVLFCGVTRTFDCVIRNCVEQARTRFQDSGIGKSTNASTVEGEMNVCMENHTGQLFNSLNISLIKVNNYLINQAGRPRLNELELALVW